MEECLDKIGYYLGHEEERQMIAFLGHHAVQEKFGYGEGIMRLFEVEDRRS